MLRRLIPGLIPGTVYLSVDRVPLATQISKLSPEFELAFRSWFLFLQAPPRQVLQFFNKRAITQRPTGSDMLSNCIQPDY